MSVPRPTDAEITRHHVSDRHDAESRVPGRGGHRFDIDVVEYDGSWPSVFAVLAGRVRDALGAAVIELHHVGSTSVPGQSAKPVIDIDLVLADPADEPSYVPLLEAAGFEHWLREPWWHEHRLLKLASPMAHLHVFAPGCPEVVRHTMFRDWLTSHPSEREVYAAAKRRAAAATRATGGNRHGLQPRQGARRPRDLRPDVPGAPHDRVLTAPRRKSRACCRSGTLASRHALALLRLRSHPLT